MTHDLVEIKKCLKRELPALAQRFHVLSLGVFGSFVRQENRPESDLDLLVTFDETPGLFQFIELENHLSDLLGLKVDLVMRDSLHPRIGKQVFSELVPV